MTFGMTLGEHLTMAASANILGVRVIIAQRKNLRGLDKNLLLNNVQTIPVKITIKLILIFLSNAFFNFFMKIKNEK